MSETNKQSTGTMIDDVKQVLKEYSGISYYFNTIPEKKLQNAKYYMNIPNTETVYALYDSTLFGSAKDGTCFTDKKIYGRSFGVIESITYDQLLKSNVSLKGDNVTVNGKSPNYAIGVGKLIYNLHKLGDPIDINKLREALSNESDIENYLELLDKQKRYERNTSFEDLMVYRALYIQAYIYLENMDKAEELLNMYEASYASFDNAKEFIETAKEAISNFRETYAKDLADLKAAVEKARKAEKESNLKGALGLLQNQEIRDDFSDDVKEEYYNLKLEIELKAEKPDLAKATIDELYEHNLISSSEKENRLKTVEKLRETLYQRYLKEQREWIEKSINMAKMFEKHDSLESASDTVNAAISGAPDELVKEKTEAFKILVELLLKQYEYSQIYELSQFYTKIASDEALGYCLKDTVEKHKNEHLDEYCLHLYSKAVYYMQVGKFDTAHKLIEDAKKVKDSFDVRCAEINLALLEFKYIESRSLLDSLKKDEEKYKNSDEVSSSIEHLEEEYNRMINAISSLLKTYAINGDTKEVTQSNQYAEFIDADGLNLPLIAARFTSIPVLETLKNKNDCFNSLTSDGFGAVFLAAMQLDYDAFKEFIFKFYNNTQNSLIINEKLEIVYDVEKESKKICETQNVYEDIAKEIAVKNLYERCALLFATLLDQNLFDNVTALLNDKKEKQLVFAKELEERLPDILQKIDAECAKRCECILSASETMNEFLRDVPEHFEKKAKNGVSEFKKAVSDVCEFANETADTMKKEKEKQVEESFLLAKEIEKKIEALKQINKESLINLFEIPVNAISYGEYDETKGKISLNLGQKTIETQMDKALVSSLLETPEKVSVESNIKIKLNLENEFTVSHQYKYCVGEISGIAEFVDKVQLTDLSAEKIIADLLI